jgi:transcriptional regulator with XRE-family HTH domain
MTEPLGVRVRRLREQRLLSIQELAQRAGVSVNAVLRVEHGRGRPRWRTLRRLAEALGVEPSALAPDDSDSAGATPEASA